MKLLGVLSYLLIQIWAQNDLGDLSELKKLKSNLENQLHQAQTFLDKSQKSNLKMNEKGQNSVPECINKEGPMKVRESDQKTKEVPITNAFLNKNRLSYYIDSKDETSIQGSIQLKNIITPIETVENFPSCFEIRTLNNVENCVICVENESVAHSWVLTITQNVINCN